jgi:predicted DNA binding protein
MARGGFLLAPTVIEAGREHWEVGLARREEGKAIVEAVSALGDDLIVEALVRDTLADLRLSEGQSRVLRAAVDGGYYEFPRRTSPTKLAKQLRLAKSTVIEHLHKAEAKVILARRDG